MVSHMVSHGIQNKSDMMSMCGSLMNGSQLTHISNYFSSFKVSKLFPDFLGASTGLCGTLFPLNDHEHCLMANSGECKHNYKPTKSNGAAPTMSMPFRNLILQHRAM